MASTSCPRTFSQKQYIILGFRIPHVLQCRSLSKEKIRPVSKTQKPKWVFHPSKFSSLLSALPPPQRKEKQATKETKDTHKNKQKRWISVWGTPATPPKVSSLRSKWNLVCAPTESSRRERDTGGWSSFPVKMYLLPKSEAHLLSVRHSDSAQLPHSANQGADSEMGNSFPFAWRVKAGLIHKEKAKLPLAKSPLFF